MKLQNSADVELQCTTQSSIQETKPEVKTPEDDVHPALNGSLTPPETAERTRNFSPGPTCLPTAVEEEVKRKCFRQSLTDKALSTIALSHRSPEFGEILERTVASTRKVMQIPPEYKILFMHGGGHGQFAAVPLNLCTSKDDIGTYVLNGTWSERAANEARKYCTVTTLGTKMSYPTEEELEEEVPSNAKFCYVCSNETVDCIELHRLPKLKVPWVVDASSDFSSKPISWRESNVGIVFACASKNIGHPGVTIVVVRNDLLDLANPWCPGFLNYTTNIRARNVWNTIATFNVDVVGIMMDWIAREGGLQEMEERSITKSKLVYDVIEASNGFYSTRLPGESGIRSRMNVPFDIARGDEAVTNKFLIEAWNRGIVGLFTKTPFARSRYLRASLYHGVSVEDAEVLVKFMEEFCEKNRSA